MSITQVVLAVDPVPNPDDVRPGWIAAVIVLALIVGTFLLWRNMRKQLTKIDFDEEATKRDRKPPAQSH
jgi:hypothetical protein